MGKDIRIVVCSLKFLLVLAVFGVVVCSQTGAAQESAPGQAIAGTGFSCSVESTDSRLTCRAQGELDLSAVMYFNLDDPDRVVVDLPGFKVKRAEVYSLVDSPIIQRVRSGQRGEGARLVLDLKGKATATVYRSDDKRMFSLDLSSIEGAPPSPPSVTPPQEPSEAQTEQSEETDAKADTTPTSPSPNLAVVPPKGAQMDLHIEKGTVPKEGILKFSVDSTFLSFEPGDRPLRDIQVTNKTSQEIFIRTYVQRVLEVNSPQERYEDTKTLISSPRRFALPPLATRSVRVIVAGKAPEEGEEVYRLILSPEPLPEGEPEAVGRVDDREVRLQVIAALGVTITLPSVEAKGVVRIESGVNKVDLINSGARAVLVENCSSCPLDSEVCTSSGKKLLYPDRPWSVPVKGSGVINCEFSMGKQKQKISSFYGAKEPR